MKKSMTLRCLPDSIPYAERLKICANAGLDAVEINFEGLWA